MRLLSAFIILTALAIAAALPTLAGTSPNPGDPTPCGSCNGNVTWPKLPLACLPDRAERWATKDEMQPCHCPPPERCPKVDALTPADVKVYVSFNTGRNCTIEGTEIDIAAKLKDGTIFTDGSLYGIIAPLVSERCSEDINNRRGDWSDVWVTVAIEHSQNLLDWINDTLQIPVDLATRCCDSICPAGMVPSFKEVPVEITVTEGEGTGNQADCDKYTKQLTDAEETLTKDKKLSDDAAKAAKDACEEPNGAPGAACDKAQKDAKDAADKVTEDQKTVDQLTRTKEAACKFPKKVTKTVMVKTVSCGSTTHMHREGCVVQGTPITLADGTTKKVEDLKLGDQVKGNEGPAKIVASTRFTQDKDTFYGINGGEAFFTIEHPILTKKGWKSVDPKITSTKGSHTKILGKLAVGDKILTKDGEVEVKSIEKKAIEGGVSAYNLKVEGDGSFIANGVILKGFNQMQMHY